MNIMEIKNIQVIVSDVDGIFTDGGMYYGAEGMVMKKFNARDGTAIHALQEAGIRVFIVTSANDEITKYRMEYLKPDAFIFGRTDKMAAIEELLSRNKIDWSKVAYAGDDRIDVEMLQKAAVSFCPLDGSFEALKSAKIIIDLCGGDGVFSRIADILLNKFIIYRDEIQRAGVLRLPKRKFQESP